MKAWRLALFVCVIVLFIAITVEAGRRSDGGGSRRRANKVSKSKDTSPPQRVDGPDSSVNGGVIQDTSAPGGVVPVTKMRKKCRQDEDGYCVSRRRGAGQKVQRVSGSVAGGSDAGGTNSPQREKSDKKRTGGRRQKNGSASTAGGQQKSRQKKQKSPTTAAAATAAGKHLKSGNDFANINSPNPP
ncbi:uncharacterized protein LOC111269797 [Varroa jacobsoni]|uniref:Uncharacterized protein n=1 Tax=Varroa destructor TaxID=109461 RepID=A0A7M7K4U1_VARDE|nr:uncharacterized protein LOC111250068 [Varroa destructor]XP_022705372.1 uncharacterized protein LOC111269797 [Varroa jacobsoni]